MEKSRLPADVFVRFVKELCRESALYRTHGTNTLGIPDCFQKKACFLVVLALDGGLEPDRPASILYRQTKAGSSFASRLSLSKKSLGLLRAAVLNPLIPAAPVHPA
jgi:hypothetical protein